MGTQPASTTAIERATGRTWPEIVTALEAAGGQALDHPALAEAAAGLIAADVENPGWWAQSIAVAYEQHIGRRLPGQRADGTFEVTVSKTLPGQRAEAFAAVRALLDAQPDFDGVPLAGRPRVSETPKRSYWRAELSDGTKLTAAVEAKRADASGAAVQVAGLTAPEAVERWRACFRGLLGTLV